MQQSSTHAVVSELEGNVELMGCPEERETVCNSDWVVCAWIYACDDVWEVAIGEELYHVSMRAWESMQ